MKYSKIVNEPVADILNGIHDGWVAALLKTDAYKDQKVCVRLFVCVCVDVGVRACVLACVRASVLACLLACVLASALASVRACVLVCAHMCRCHFEWLS